MIDTQNASLLSSSAMHILKAPFVLLFCFCLFPQPVAALQLTPTSVTAEEDRTSPWSESEQGEDSGPRDERLGFLDTGELPQSIEQLRAMQVRFKSLSEQVKNATVSITMRNGQGTGVLVSSDGVILTAAHVIGRPRRVALITFRDGSRARAITLGVEAGKDSGMLKITEMLDDNLKSEASSDGESSDSQDIAPGELPAPGDTAGDQDKQATDIEDDELSDSDTSSTESESDEDVIAQAFSADGLPFFDYLDVGVSKGLKAGQWVMAVGHPGGIDEKRGMVVRVGRIINQNDSSLRTDCTLVGGDSGGPLVDMQGNVIAIHSRIGGRIQDNIHVNVDVFSDTWDKLSRGLKIGEQGRLGLSVNSDSNIVSAIQKGGPADQAGIRVGDIVDAIGNRDVDDKRSLARSLRGKSAFEKLPVKIRRGSQLMELEVMLLDVQSLAEIRRRANWLKSKKLQGNP